MNDETRPVEQIAKQESQLLEAIRRIIHGYDLHSRRLLATAGVTLAQLLCLRTLAEGGPCTAREMAARIHLSASTMVGILDRLEAKGLISRLRDADDRRRVWVSIRPPGLEVVGESPPPLGEGLRRHLAGLSPAKRASLSAALERLADLL